jgi:hypothetical protein
MHAVKYTGDFGFIKPFSALRDIKTYSVLGLTPSIVMGIETKLFGDCANRIISHRLSFTNIVSMKEQATSIGYKIDKNKNNTYRKKIGSVIERFVLVNPCLYLLVNTIEEAEEMSCQNIRLTRNEEILFPSKDIITVNDQNAFDSDDFEGYELVSCDENNLNGQYYGSNKYTGKDQYAFMKVVGIPEVLK